eukprot:scaffold105707_cov25-Tisochrysis_lutea.AAC.2
MDAGSSCTPSCAYMASIGWASAAGPSLRESRCDSAICKRASTMSSFSRRAGSVSMTGGTCVKTECPGSSSSRAHGGSRQAPPAAHRA